MVQDSLNAVLFPPFSERTGDEPNFGRAKAGEMYDELANSPVQSNGAGPIPRFETESFKIPFQGDVMRRGVISGKVDDGTSVGDLTTTAASIVAPLVVGKVISTPEAPQTVRSVGALPEIKPTGTIKAIGEPRANEPTQIVKNKFPDEPLPTDGRIDGVARIENGRIKLDKSISTNNPIDFVIDKQGKLILGSKHHFLGNADEVQAVGQMKIAGGKIKKITNGSGHYQPTVEEAKKYPDILRKMGLELKNTHLELWDFKTDANGIILDRIKVVDEYLK